MLLVPELLNAAKSDKLFWLLFLHFGYTGISRLVWWSIDLLLGKQEISNLLSIYAIIVLIVKVLWV